MLRWATATALLAVLAAGPALAFVCAARCAQPARQGEHGGAGGHAHHAQSSGFGLQSPVLQTDHETVCGPHVDVDLAAPERSAFAVAAPAPERFRLLEPLAPARRAGPYVEQRPPPIEPPATTPLRI